MTTVDNGETTMKYGVLEKDLATDNIVSAHEFSSLVSAEAWAEEMMECYEEKRAYKILPLEPQE